MKMKREAMERWDVWLVTYATYEEIRQHGDRPARLVAPGLSFDEAARMVDERGFGYCMKPAGGGA
jgi:hypothetical protein